jgi:uncharacterized protein
VVKPGQIVKVKVMEVDEKRQRISLTMRLDDAPATGARSGGARADGNTGAARAPRERGPSEPQPGGAIALALERAKLKK